MLASFLEDYPMLFATPVLGTSSIADTRALQDALAAAALALGMQISTLFQSERNATTVGTYTAKLATDIASRVPGADQDKTLSMLGKQSGGTPPIAWVDDNAAVIAAVMNRVAAGLYGGIAALPAKSHKGLIIGLIIGAVAVVGGITAVVVTRRRRHALAA
jgi:hypothetical protein